MANPFETHGITHLSPSSLNLFIQQPGIWALRYLARQKDAGNVKMWRGNAVEKGFVAYLRSSNVELAYQAAMESFIYDVTVNNAQGEAAEKETMLIEPMLDQCMLWTPPSMLLAAQIEVEHWFGSVPVPIKGFIDLSFEGTDTDLKTTMRIPSKLSESHIRQVALYRAARQKAGGLLYVSDKRWAYYDVTDEMMAKGISELEDAAIKLFKLLGSFEKSEDILAVLPVDYESYLAPPRDRALRSVSAADFEVVDVNS